LAFIFFPRKRKPRESAEPNRGSAAGKNRQSPIILIADRDSNFAISLSQELKSRGNDCILASGVVDAFARSLQVVPNVVVLAYDIARKGDGIELAKQILSQRPLMKIVMLTDIYSRIDKKEERIGIELFTEKSLGIQKIASTICGISELRKTAFRLVAK